MLLYFEGLKVLPSNVNVRECFIMGHIPVVSSAQSSRVCVAVLLCAV